MAVRNHTPLRSAYSNSHTDWKDRLQERQRSQRLLAVQVGLRSPSGPKTKKNNRSILYFGKHGIMFCRDHEPCLMFGFLDANVNFLGTCTKCPTPPREAIYTYSASGNTVTWIV